jgi:hypothetical protein
VLLALFAQPMMTVGLRRAVRRSALGDAFDAAFAAGRSIPLRVALDAVLQ